MPTDDNPTLFDEIKVIGELPPRRVASKLRQMGDQEGAQQYLSEHTDGQQLEGLFGWGEPKAWEHTAHQFGFIAPPAAGAVGTLPIQHAGTIQADATLKNARINVHLDRLRIYDYPGGGEHSVMFTFMAQNQIACNPELVSFSQMYDAQEKQSAGVTGWPIFISLGVGALGVAFQFCTTSVGMTGYSIPLWALLSTRTTTPPLYSTTTSSSGSPGTKKSELLQ